MFKIDVNNVYGKDNILYVYGDNSILAELEKHNINISYNCRQGYCGHCIVNLIEGDIIHQDNLVPLAKGEILACMAVPITDIKISLRAPLY